MGNRGEIVRIKEQYKETILAKPNVVGVGTGYKVVGGVISDDLCIMAMVSKKIPKAGLDPDALVPSELDGNRPCCTTAPWSQTIVSSDLRPRL